MKTACKSNTIKLKLYEDPLQSRIYFLTLVESLRMIFYQYKETCEVLLYYPKIGGENIKYFVKKSIGNLLHTNIDVYIRRLIAEVPEYRVKCIEELQSHCANMTFSGKIRHDRIFSKSHIKEGSLQ